MPAVPPAGAATRWFAVAAVAAGSGIWATHFLAMLAFEPGLPSGYGVGLTGPVATPMPSRSPGSASPLATTRRAGSRAAIGGAVAGGGIAAMHYTGMAAYRDRRAISLWDPALVARLRGASGPRSAAVALPVGLSAATIRGRVPRRRCC